MFVQGAIASPGPYAPPLLGLAPLQAQVHVVTPRWLPTTGVGLGPALSWHDLLGHNAKGSPRFLLLGSNAGIVVLYERTTHTVVRLPASRIAVT